MVCCEYVLLPLINKEDALASRIELGRKIKLNAERKKVETGRYHVTAEGEGYQNIISKSQPHGDTQINRSGII